MLVKKLYLEKKELDSFVIISNQPQTNYAQKIGDTRNTFIKVFNSIQTFKTSIWIT